jgi:hypothetical protein
MIKTTNQPMRMLTRIYNAFSYRRNFPYEGPIPGDFSDILLQDISSHTLYEAISAALQQSYLAPYQLLEKQAKGIVYGPYCRSMICLPVRAIDNRQSFGVHFLIDTGSPTTYLENKAISAIFDK